MDNGAIHLALRNRLIAVAGIPASQYRAFENKTFTPDANQTYISEEFVPGGSTLLTTVSNGIRELTGLYVVKWYGIADSGITAIRTGVDAILTAFPPGYSQALGSGDVLRIRADTAPYAGQILPDGAGRAVCTITIPWRCYTSNPAS